MNDKICYIIGAGDNHGLDFTAKDGDYVIAADGGLDHLQAQGIAPDLIIGDFDSVKSKPIQGNVLTLNPEKDFTDMYEAIKIGVEKGYTRFHIYCGTGGRFDHTFANIQALAYLSKQGKTGCLVGKDCVITAIANGGITFDACCEGYVSVFSYSDKSAGVCLEGLKYVHLENNELTSICPMGVSNEFTGAESTITVADGTLVVIFPRRYKNNVREVSQIINN